MALTSVNDLTLRVEKVNRLEKFIDASPYKRLVKAILEEDSFQVPQAHLGRLEDENRMFTTGS